MSETAFVGTEDDGYDWGRAAADGFQSVAQYWRTVPNDAWKGPTGASEWNMRVLADHITGEAVWFANLVRGVTAHEDPLPGKIYEEMKAWPIERLAGAVEESGEALRSAIGEAGPDAMRATVDMGFEKLPLWRATYVSLAEAAFHGWDARVGRDPEATIPRDWALQLVRGIEWFAPSVAHRAAAERGPGHYLLRVGDEVGPITVAVEDGSIALQPGEVGQPEVAMSLTADQFVRLIAGRLDLGRLIERGAVRVEGDSVRVPVLQRIFRGIANGD